MVVALDKCMWALSDVALNTISSIFCCGTNFILRIEITLYFGVNMHAKWGMKEKFRYHNGSGIY